MPDFSLSEEQELLQQLAYDFASEEIAPLAGDLDRSGEFPWEVARKAFDVGLMNIIVPEDYGGPGLGTFEDALVTEQLATGCMGITLWFIIITQSTQCFVPILMP